MSIISFASIKGGVAKTTTCVNLAAALSQKNKILIVDFDAQGGATHHLSSKFNGKYNASLSDILESKCNVKHAIHKYNENLDIIPVSHQFSKISCTDFSDQLKPFIKEVREKYDFIFFDLSPAIFPGAVIPLSHSDYAIIPVYVQGGLSLLGLESQGRMIADIQQKGGKVDILGVLATFVDRTKMSKEVIEYLKSECKDEFLNTTIRKNTALSQASSLGKTIIEYKPKSYGAKDYKELAKEITKRLKQKKGSK